MKRCKQLGAVLRVGVSVEEVVARGIISGAGDLPSAPYLTVLISLSLSEDD